MLALCFQKAAAESNIFSILAPYETQNTGPNISLYAAHQQDSSDAPKCVIKVLLGSP